MSRIQEILDLAKAEPNLSCKKIAERLKASYNLVTDVLNTHGIINTRLDADEKEQEVVRLFNAVEDMTNTQIARIVGLSRQNVAVILDKHNLRKAKVSCAYKCPEKWKEIHHLLETTTLSSKQIAEKVGISLHTMQKFTRFNSYDVKSRFHAFKRMGTTADKVETRWPEIKKLLDDTDIPMQDIANKFSLPYREFKTLCERHNYPTKERKKRLVSTGSAKVHASYDKSESLDGKGLSTLAHRLPLNRIAEVFR